MKGIGRRTRGTLVFLAMAIVISGCYEHRYTIGAGGRGGELVYDHWHNHWLGGLISPGQEIALREICPSGNATIHEETTFLNGLVEGLTSGIYGPTTVKVWCGDGRRGDLEFGPEDVARVLSTPDFLEWVAVMAPDRLEEVKEALLAP